MAARDLVQCGGSGFVGREIDEQLLVVICREIEGFVYEAQWTGLCVFDSGGAGRGWEAGGGSDTARELLTGHDLELISQGGGVRIVAEGALV